jgi:hypothetical protein
MENNWLVPYYIVGFLMMTFNYGYFNAQDGHVKMNIPNSTATVVLITVLLFAKEDLGLASSGVAVVIWAVGISGMAGSLLASKLMYYLKSDISAMVQFGS